MRRCALRLTMTMALIMFVSTAAWAGLSTSTNTGDCSLQKAKRNETKKHVTVTVGEKLKANCAFYLEDFMGVPVLKAGAQLTNSSEKTMFYSYHVAFFDADNKMLACSSLGGLEDDGLKPGKKMTLSIMIVLPDEITKKIASYQVTLHETDKRIEGDL